MEKQYLLFRRLVLIVLLLLPLADSASAAELPSAPGQPSLLTRDVSMKSAEGTAVHLLRGEYVRVRKVTGEQVEVAAMGTTGRIPLDSLYSIQQLREQAGGWLESIKKGVHYLFRPCPAGFR